MKENEVGEREERQVIAAEFGKEEDKTPSTKNEPTVRLNQTTDNHRVSLATNAFIIKSPPNFLFRPVLDRIISANQLGGTFHSYGTGMENTTLSLLANKYSLKQGDNQSTNSNEQITECDVQIED